MRGGWRYDFNAQLNYLITDCPSPVTIFKFSNHKVN